MQCLIVLETCYRLFVVEFCYFNQLAFQNLVSRFHKCFECFIKILYPCYSCAKTLIHDPEFCKVWFSCSYTLVYFCLYTEVLKKYTKGYKYKKKYTKVYGYVLVNRYWFTKIYEHRLGYRY